MVEIAENRPSFKEHRGDWIGLQADQISNQLHQIKEHSNREDSSLTPQQVENILGHVLLASEYLDSVGKNGESLRGAFELTDSISLIVGPKAPDFEFDLQKLSNLIRGTACGAQYRVRRLLAIPEVPRGKRIEPENSDIYLKLAEHAYRRDQRLNKMTSKPDEDLPPDLNEEVASWLLNTPPKI